MNMKPTTGTIRTTCAYCGVGCGVLATPEPDGSVSIARDSEHPANFGRLCSKGSALGETIGLEDRLLSPRIEGRDASWDEALERVASGFAKVIAEDGPDAVAFYVSGQFLTEDYYVANKLMKGFIGSGNIDTNSRLCMASSVAGHRRAFGADTVPGTYRDLEEADLVILVGSNLAWCHPVTYQRLAAAKAARPNMKIVLIDPRRTASAEIADMHLAIEPDGDTALFSGLLYAIAEGGAVHCDFVARHTEGFVDALRASRALPVAKVAAATGLDESAIRAFYDLFTAREKVVTVYSQGVNQSVSGTDKVNAIINCHLATGRIGRPGMGPFSITGQPNAMGGREVGGLANQLAAHMAIESAADRALVEDFWRAPNIAQKPGLKAVDLFRAVETGKVKAIWIAGTNPVVSMPDADRVKAALAACPLVVVSDVVARNDTLPFAHVALPAAAWGEKDGTVTNSERRISRQRPFLPLPGEARPDWAIFAEVGRRMGFSGFDFANAAEVFDEHARLSAYRNEGSRDFDIGGLAGLPSDDYDALNPVQWPVKASDNESGEKRFFADGRFFHPNGKARFVAVRAPVREAAASGEFVLNTGRVRDHWHTMTRTGRSARLSAHTAEPFAELHPEDGKQLGLKPADLVTIRSAHGAATVRCLFTERQRRGSVFVPIHWSGEFAGTGRIDAVVRPSVDPVSGQPGLKSTPVTLSRFRANWYGFAVSLNRPETTASDYLATARTGAGWRTELAGIEALDDAANFARHLIAPSQEAEFVAYSDAKTGTHRFAAFERSRLVGALWIAREPVAVARNWAVGQIDADARTSQATGVSRAHLLAGRTGADRPDPGAIVCSCFSIGVNEIAAAVVSGQALSVEAVGRHLKAGTNCGSCRSEIKAIVDAKSAEPQPAEIELSEA